MWAVSSNQFVIVRFCIGVSVHSDCTAAPTQKQGNTTRKTTYFNYQQLNAKLSYDCMNCLIVSRSWNVVLFQFSTCVAFTVSSSGVIFRFFKQHPFAKRGHRTFSLTLAAHAAAADLTRRSVMCQRSFVSYGRTTGVLGSAKKLKTELVRLTHSWSLWRSVLRLLSY